jgi:methyl-accepting chemotaxis protein
VQIAGSDEIGTLARAVNEMLEAIAHQEAELAVSQAAQANAQAQAEALVRSTATEVGEQLGGVASNASRVSDAAENIDARVAETADMTVRASARSAEANRSMDELRESTQRITEITKVITSIAEQTNLLALNATIEAARAGEAGKGFAVVAGEVKSLANMTADSTGTINETIEKIQQDSLAVADVIAEVVNAIEGIRSSTNEIVGATGEQRATVEDLTRQLREAHGRVDALARGGVSSAARRFGVRDSNTPTTH